MPAGPTAVRIQATSGSGSSVFVGVAPAADVDRYLAASAHADITDFEVGPFRPELRDIPAGVCLVIAGSRRNDDGPLPVARPQMPATVS